MSETSVTDSKAKILAEFQQILLDRNQIESKVLTKEEEAEKENRQNVLGAASQYTVDNIVTGLANLQLDFGTTVRTLSTNLNAETAKLEELKQAIEIARQRLQESKHVRVVADTLHLLAQEHQEKLKRIEQTAAEQQEALEKEISAARECWQSEQAEHDTAVSEREQLLTRQRQRQEEDDGYETEQVRRMELDDYAARRRKVERELQETGQDNEKQWLEREQKIAANQSLLEEYQQKIEAFPNELEEATKKAREEGIREINQSAKVKADLFEKEWEASKQGYELQIQSLEEKIQRQAEQIAEVSAQLQAASRQSQELAMRAFQNSSNQLSAAEQSE